MGNIVARYWSLATDFTYLRHVLLPLSHSPTSSKVMVECMNGLLVNNEYEFALLPSFPMIGKYFYINFCEVKGPEP
jgi:hypothetical protein